MASQKSSDFYKNPKDMSPIRAIAETIMNNHNVRKIDIREAYEMARKQPGVSETDLRVFPEFIKLHNLPEDTRVLNDTHGNIIGRTAKARRFYNREDPHAETSWKETSVKRLSRCCITRSSKRKPSWAWTPI